MTAVTAGLDVILEEDPRVGLLGVTSGACLFPAMGTAQQRFLLCS